MHIKWARIYVLWVLLLITNFDSTCTYNRQYFCSMQTLFLFHIIISYYYFFKAEDQAQQANESYQDILEDKANGLYKDRFFWSFFFVRCKLVTFSSNKVLKEKVSCFILIVLKLQQWNQVKIQSAF